MRKSTDFFRNITDSEKKIAKKSDGEETPLQKAGKETKEPCGAAANEKPGKRLLWLRADCWNHGSMPKEKWLDFKL